MQIKDGLLAFLLILLPASVEAQQHQHGNEQPAGKAAPAKTSAGKLQPAEGAKIKILAPTKGETIKGNKVEIHYQLTKGKRGHHAHAYVDGELMGMFESAKGTLNGVKPAMCWNCASSPQDHDTKLDATDKVTFTVK